MFHGSMAATVHKEPANFGMSVCCSSPPSVGPRIHVPLGGGLGLRKCASACSASTRGWLRQASRNQEIAFVFSPYTIIVQGPTVKNGCLQTTDRRLAGSLVPLRLKPFVQPVVTVLPRELEGFTRRRKKERWLKTKHMWSSV
jgi:hypothetical protein